MIRWDDFVTSTSDEYREATFFHDGGTQSHLWMVKIISDVLNACDIMMKPMKPSRLLIPKITLLQSSVVLMVSGSPGSVSKCCLTRCPGRAFSALDTSHPVQKLPVKTLGWEMGDYFPFEKRSLFRGYEASPHGPLLYMLNRGCPVSPSTLAIGFTNHFSTPSIMIRSLQGNVF